MTPNLNYLELSDLRRTLNTEHQRMLSSPQEARETLYRNMELGILSTAHRALVEDKLFSQIIGRISDQKIALDSYIKNLGEQHYLLGSDIVGDQRIALARAIRAVRKNAPLSKLEVAANFNFEGEARYVQDREGGPSYLALTNGDKIIIGNGIESRIESNRSV